MRSYNRIGEIRYFTNRRHVDAFGTKNLNDKQKKIVEKYCLDGASAKDIAMLFYGNKKEAEVRMAKSYLEDLTMKSFLVRRQDR